MQWKDLSGVVGKILPVAGGLLGGPLGEKAGELVAGALGVANTPNAVSQAIAASPQAAAQILQMQFTHADKLLDLQNQQMTLDAGQNSAQVELNKIEAGSPNLFNSGWRPFIGWVCGAAFAYSYLILPFLFFLLKIFNSPIKVDDLPKMDWSVMMPVMLGMLGLGGLRTYEKVQKVEDRHG